MTDDGSDLGREIEALIERARDAGYAEVGHFLSVAAEALKAATADQADRHEPGDFGTDDESDDFLNAC